jgi:PKD repeat protein
MRIKIFFLLALFSAREASSQLIANFSASPLALCVGAPVTFTDLSSSTAISWAWNFGDGNTSNLENPTHIYSAAGTYNITLTVSNGTTAVAEVKSNYILVHPLPVAGFATPAIGCSIPYAPVFTAVSPGGGGYTYSWDFGNGQTSTTQTPTTVSYATTGSYNVNLTVTNTATGCVNSSSQTISVFNFDTDFDVSATTICAGQPVNFTDQSVGANSWSWNFGNGSGSTSQNPTISYSLPGTYTVTLTSQNTSNGCSGTATQTITVLPLPQPSFTGDPIFGCNPLVVDFTNTSIGGGTFQWNFGNGSTFNGSNPPDQTYLTVGDFDVSLTMIGSNGCSKTVSLNDYISTEPLDAEFTMDQTEGCEDLPVQFTDLSASPNPTDNPITGWFWDFGNGNTFNGEFPPVQLYSEGVYSVSLTVTTDGGCTQTITKTDSIKAGIPPTPSFTHTPFSQCAKSDFFFTNTTVIPPGYGPDDVDYFWDFGDGGTSEEENPTYNYPNDTGFFDVMLIVYLNGCPDSITLTDAVDIIAPIANFSPAQSVYCNPTLPLSIEMTDMAILGETTDNVQMIWNWSEGGSNTLTSPALFTNPENGTITHIYNNYGTFIIEQVVHNLTTGCSDSVEQIIHISNIDAAFNLINDSVCRGLPFTLSNASISTHPITNYLYNLNGDTTLTGPNQTFTYNTSGTYDFSLFILNSVGCSNTQLFNDFVVLQQPLAQITASDASGCAPLNVIFSNNSSVQGNGVGLDFFLWTFENGTTQTTTTLPQTTNYTFTTTGTFTTTLQVTDDFGCVSAPATVTTTVTTPTAAFTMDSVVCNFEPFTATNTSSSFTSSQWFLDGVLVSNLTNYTHTFSETNSSNLTSISHVISLVVIGANGCTDTLTKTITISFPQADGSYVFTGSNVNGNGDFTCPPVFADLTDNSASYGSITQWQWAFGDDNFSTLQNPSNTYVFAGTYTATLNITDQFGCSDSISFIDYLTIGGPSGDVEWIKIGDECNPEYQFIPSNLVGVTSITWNMGDMSTTSSTETFTYIYNNPGIYLPSALLKDDFNCVVYYEMPLLTTLVNVIHANFSVDPITIPVYESMVVDDSSYGGSGGVETWSWLFGSDGFTNNSGTTFTYEWQTPGIQNITLTVSDSLGCTDTMQIIVLVTAELFIPNVFTVDGDGINETFVLREPVFVDYEVLILNRWGYTVSKAEDQNGVYLWDGKDRNGDTCPEGTYFYVLEGVRYDGVQVNLHGAVTLVVTE